MSQVCIIGGGVSGLATAKAALDMGLEPIILEKAESIGGLWRPNTGSVWDSLKTNVSNYSMDLGMPHQDSTPRFLHKDEVYRYLFDFSQQYNLDQYTNTQTNVTKVTPFDNQWKVEWLQNGEHHVQVFPNLVIASGVFSKSYIPDIKGLKDFEGTVIHSKDYKNANALKNKRVVVIGNAFSGSEITCDLVSSNQCQKVTNFARRKLFVMNPYCDNVPWDLVFFKRFIADQKKPTSYTYATISEKYDEYLDSGKFDLKLGQISHIQKDGVVLDNGEKISADALIFSTGYRTELSYLDPKICEAVKFDPQDSFLPMTLYKSMLHPDFDNLGFVGMYRGPHFSVIQLQAQALMSIFAKKISMPERQELMFGMDSVKKLRESNPKTQYPYPNNIEFCDGIASLIGAKPEPKDFHNDYNLWNMIYKGPFSLAHYGLKGVYAQPEYAKKHIKQLQKAVNEL
ncbi:MAG: NAD(P)-binding domain-containing protein [Parachlamydiales bacterium]|nr:NAD(P)-binding domain-containing protein [Parachlamydiales bacterium]